MTDKTLSADDELMALIDQKQKTRAATAARVDVVRIENGKSRYRILPSWRTEGPKQNWHDFGKHFIKGVDKQVKAAHICAAVTFGRPCRICDAIAEGTMKSVDDSVINTLKEAKASKRVLVNALCYDGPNAGKVVILEMPNKLFYDLLETSKHIYTTEGINIFSPTAGMDIYIERKGVALTTTYTMQTALKQTAVDPKVLAQLHDIDAYVAQESEEQLNKALLATRAVAGLLSGDVAAAAARAKDARLLLVDEGPDATAVLDADIPPVKAAKPADPPFDVEVKSGTGDDELDAILGDLKS